MSLVESLLTAIVRLDGDALVLHVGEKPYVVTSSAAMNALRGPLAWGQVELSTRPLATEAVSAMLDQLLSTEQRRVLDEMGAVENILPAAGDRPPFSVIAARGGDDIWIEVRPVRPKPVTAEIPHEHQSDSPTVTQSDDQVVAQSDSALTSEEPPEIAVPAAPQLLVDVPIEDLPTEPHEAQFELVQEDEQEIPDEAEVTELLSGAGLLGQATPQEPPAPEPEPVTPDRLPDRLSDDEPQAPAPVCEPLMEIEAVPLDTSIVDEPTRAVVLPLARTLRETAGVHTVTPAPTLDRLLKIAAARGASGLYLVAQTAPVLRVEGEMQPLGDEELLTSQEIDAFVLHLAPEPSREAVRSGATPEWFCDVPELGRVRCLSFQDHRGPGLIVRMLPPRAISAEQLGLSREIQALCAQPDGLVLVAGPRSSGKSTLVAAFVDLVNRTRSDHVVTIERQITFVHAPRKSFVSQREVRGEAEEIASAVRAALREDPDVLVIEDLRSPEITASAVEAAESGRLVLAGVRAPGTAQAVQRLIEQFPPERRRQVESSLAATLRGVVAQVLLRKRGGGRVAARELLLNSPAAASLIAEGKAFQLPAAIESGRKLGSVALNDTLVGLIRDGIVDSGEAWRRAWDRDGLLTLLKRESIDTSFVERLA